MRVSIGPIVSRRTKPRTSSNVSSCGNWTVVAFNTSESSYPALSAVISFLQWTGGSVGMSPNVWPAARSISIKGSASMRGWKCENRQSTRRHESKVCTHSGTDWHNRSGLRYDALRRCETRSSEYRSARFSNRRRLRGRNARSLFIHRHSLERVSKHRRSESTYEKRFLAPTR